MPSINVKFINVKYSPNLGDGLLVDCLEWACKQCMPDASVSSMDLAGRVAYQEGPSTRAMLLSALSAVPGTWRGSLVAACLRSKVRYQLDAFYREQLRGVDAIVIGGGHLLSDTDLNFPIKLDAALSVVAEAQIPVWIYGCGVSSKWSPAAFALFARALRPQRLVDVFVRDGASKRFWDTRLATLTLRPAKVVRDPGLLAARAYDVSRDASALAAKRIGVGVIAPVAISYHGGDRISAGTLAAWYERLIEGLVRRGRVVTLVSNGSPEDTSFGRVLVRRLAPRLPRGALTFPQPRAPRDLVYILSRQSAYVGFRLHGLVCAHAFGLPVFALSWDRKIDAFMESVDRQDRVFHVRRHSPESVLNTILREPVRTELPGSTVDVMSGVEELCRSIETTLGREPRDRPQARRAG